jgi:hypothetical protein
VRIITPKFPNPPAEYREKHSKFYYGKDSAPNDLGWALWQCMHGVRGPKGEELELVSQLFIEPLRRGNSGHFRRISDAIERFGLTEGKPFNHKHPKGVEDEPEHHFFMAFEILRITPIIVGKWPTRGEVEQLALSLWAISRFGQKLATKDSKAGFNILDLTKEQQALVDEEVRNLPETSWHTWKNTGLRWLKPTLGRPPLKRRK